MQRQRVALELLGHGPPCHQNRRTCSINSISRASRACSGEPLARTARSSPGMRSATSGASSLYRLACTSSMGHSTTRAALIYQHRTSARDKKIADAISKLTRAEHPRSGTTRGERQVTDSLMFAESRRYPGASVVERVTGIEPALSAWESTDITRNMHHDQHFRGSASDRETPLITVVNGPLMARLECWRERVMSRTTRSLPSRAVSRLCGDLGGQASAGRAGPAASPPVLTRPAVYCARIQLLTSEFSVFPCAGRARPPGWSSRHRRPTLRGAWH
jgi:hypothetical protein